ncbi:MAG: hypothetical protein H6529_13265 [Nocardioides sp.]|nr:hypothetical protein [Nocardioidaceae bacterium]MCB8957432.1 hypothetical protein [Nocardioides sp.]
MTAVPDLHRLRDLLEVSRGPVADALADVVGIPRTRAEDALLDAGIDPETPAAAVTDAEVGRVRGRLVAVPDPRRDG